MLISISVEKTHSTKYVYSQKGEHCRKEFLIFFIQVEALRNQFKCKSALYFTKNNQIITSKMYCIRVAQFRLASEAPNLSLTSIYADKILETARNNL